MYNTVSYTVSDKICTIALNRPQTYNAFNAEMGREFLAALQNANQDENVRVIVVTGTGKAFCSGQDLKEIDGTVESIVESCYNPIIRQLTSIDKPIVCRLNGIAAGAGASIALACDYIIAAENASLLWAFVNIGLVWDSGVSYLLPRLIGMRKTFELATLGERLFAADALRLNLINQVVSPENLDEAVNKIATKYANSAPISIAIMKRMMRVSFESNLEQMLQMEKMGQAQAEVTEDAKEGIAAFVEKRKANFQGK